MSAFCSSETGLAAWHLLTTGAGQSPDRWFEKVAFVHNETHWETLLVGGERGGCLRLHHYERSIDHSTHTRPGRRHMALLFGLFNGVTWRPGLGWGGGRARRMDGRAGTMSSCTAHQSNSPPSSCDIIGMQPRSCGHIWK